MHKVYEVGTRLMLAVTVVEALHVAREKHAHEEVPRYVIAQETVRVTQSATSGIGTYFSIAGRDWSQNR